MRRFLYAVLALCSLAGPGLAQRQFATGRVPPRNLAALHQAAAKRVGNKVAQLPKATQAAFDCRAKGWVPPVKDQGQCGSCWDFSGTGMVTCSFIKAGWGKPDGSFDLSEQYTMDCGQNGGCNGDDNTTVLVWAKATGLPLTADYGPYRAREGRCGFKSGTKLWQITDWGFCTPSQKDGVASPQDIKNAMLAYGPIGSAIAADDAFMNIRPGTVFSGSGSRNIDHDIILVGWDDSKGKNGAWLLRNSWGTQWCDQGYCWIEYGANLVGTEAVWCVAPPGTPPRPPNPWVFSAQAPEPEPRLGPACCAPRAREEPLKVRAGLRFAYEMEQGRKKAKYVRALAELYRTAGCIQACNPAYDTVGKFHSAWQATVKAALGAEALPKVAGFVALDLAAKLPTDPAAPMDEPTRRRIVEAFEDIARQLDTIGPAVLAEEQ